MNATRPVFKGIRASAPERRTSYAHLGPFLFEIRFSFEQTGNALPGTAAAGVAEPFWSGGERKRSSYDAGALNPPRPDMEPSTEFPAR
jgi:hypothetical protein